MKKILIYLILCIPFIGHSQTSNGSLMMRPSGSSPSITASISSLSGFSTTAGTPSISQQLTISGTNLTVNGTVTAPSGYEVSLDNSNFASTKTVTESGGTFTGQPITIYVRIAAATPAGSPAGNVVITSTPAIPKNVAVSGTVNSGTSTLSTSPTSLTGFTSVLSSPSTSQSYTLSGSNLSTNVTISASSGCEVSTDNSNFSSSLTVSQAGGSVNATIYVRLSIIAPSGNYSGTVSNASTGATTQTVSVSGTVTAPTGTIFNFSSTASSVAGATNFYGDPTASPSFTDLGTGWTLAAVGANWVKYAGAYYGGVNNAATQASTDGTFTQAQIGSNLYSINSWTGSPNGSTPNYCLQLTNLPAGNYQIILLGSIQTAVFPNGGNSEFHVQFGTGTDNVAFLNPNGSGSTGNLASSGPGTTNVMTGSFNGTITSGQTINIFLGKGTGAIYPNTPYGSLGFISAIKITKTN